MPTRYNTGNPIESTDVRDMSDNAKNFDEFSNSSSITFTDRFGVNRPTIEGVIEKSGFKPGSGDFSSGFTVNEGMRNLAWLNPLPSGDNNWYSWSGEIPAGGKVVPPNSTPSSTGGSMWVQRTDQLLRADLASADGASNIGFSNPSDPELPSATNLDVYTKRLASSINLAFRDISNYGYTEGMGNALPAIQAAIDSLPARGGVVMLPPHHINIAPVAGKMIELGDGDSGTSFSTKNGIKLVGAGAGFGVSGALVPTILNYAGSTISPSSLISVKGRVSDCRIEGVFLSLNGKCGGISINATSGSDFESIKIVNPAPSTAALSVIGGSSPVGNYNVFNRFSKISIGLLSPNSIGLYMDGDWSVQNDTWISNFELMRIENFAGATGTKMAWFKFVDSCTFTRCHFDNKPEPNSLGVVFDGASNNDFPSGLAFYDCSVHQTSVIESPTGKILKNYFYGLGVYDNEILPTDPRLCGITAKGEVFGEFLYGSPWKSVAATITSGSGAITTVAGAVQYQVLGATVNIRGTVFITTNGTGAGFIRIQLPVGVPSSLENCFFVGRNTTTGGALVGQMAAASNTIFLRKFDDTYPGANGAQLEFSGSYMVIKV